MPWRARRKEGRKSVGRTGVGGSLGVEPEAGSAIPSVVMLREAAIEPRQEPRQEILRTAARLFQQQGYDATSMNDVAAALKLSKGGLYHHFQSKDEILFHIMSHAMDITEEQVINVVRRIDGSQIDVTGSDVTVERLRTLIRLHIQVVLSPEDREITVMLHENHPLPPALRRKINGRKKDYLHFVEHLIADVQRKRNSLSAVTPRAAALALVGMINWIYQWYKADGPLTGEALVEQYTDIFFHGAIG
jgi:TetR/AcrR family transcriptional regulator, cholesterol catabolism regulator